MKILMCLIVLSLTVACASKPKEGHDKEHQHVTGQVDHDHAEDHHKAHNHKAHHPDHKDEKKPVKKKKK